MDALWQNLSYATRTLRRTPAFTAVGILLLALGIGANSAVFSVVYAVLLRPLPYPEPSQLVQLVRGESPQVSVPEFTFVNDQSRVFSAVALHRPGGQRLLNIDDAYQQVIATLVTSDFLKTLRVNPAAGREFRADETAPNGPRSAILTDSLARRLFQNPGSAVGRFINLDEVNFSVVGVLPPTFWFPQETDLLLPFPYTGTATDNGANSTLIARLKPNATQQQASAELLSFRAAIRQANPLGLKDPYAGLTPVSLQQQIAGKTLRTNLVLLFGAVGLLLLIACSNLASLILARLTARRKEIAVRLALGSGAFRLFQQFLLENLLLGIAGGSVALLLGTWLLQGLLAIVPFQLPSAQPIELNLAALGLTSLVAILASLTASCLPLWAAARMNIGGALKAGSRGIQGEPRQAVRSGLVVAQVAASVTLLVCAALLIQTLYHLRQDSLGFDTAGITTFSTPPKRGATPAQTRQFHAELLSRLQALPGIQAAAAINVLPLTEPNNFPTQRDGHPEQSIGGMEIRQVTPDYFAAMGIPIVRGRPFSTQDNAAGAPVILVSEGVAHAWWNQQSPLGDRVVIGRFQGRTLGEDKPRAVVGVVADTKARNLTEPSRPTVYVPMQQWEVGTVSWVVRGDISADRLRSAVAEINPTQRVDRLRSMQEIVAGHTRDPRFDAWIFGGMAFLALLLTTIGVYGLLAYSVARRTHEIGTRMALGATPGDVLRLILRQGGGLLISGLVVGLIAARYLSDLLQSLLFGTLTTDWSSYLAASAALLITGLLASYFPARRAARVDPLVALRAGD